MAVCIAAAALAPLPAQARGTGWRDAGGVAGQLGLRGLLGSFHNALRSLFDLARGGMDPNGSPDGGG